MTGEKMLEQTISNPSYSINTTGWKAGVYVINAIVGDEVLSEKIVVK